MRRVCGYESLELASLDVAQAVEGSAASWSHASLTLRLRDLSEHAKHGPTALQHLDVRALRSGDSVRIAHVRTRHFGHPHGERLRFAAVIFALGFLDTLSTRNARRCCT
jgi:hypothetical protein